MCFTTARFEKFDKPSRRQTEDDFSRLFVLPKMARRFDNYGNRHLRSTRLGKDLGLRRFGIWVPKMLAKKRN